MSPKKNVEEVIPMVDSANQEVLDYSIKEDAEADRLFYEAQGLQADGKTPLDEDAPAIEAEEVEAKAETKETEGKPLAEVIKKEEPKEDDLTVDLTVENADKRISSAQKKMHESNKTAKDAIDETNKLRKENEDLRRLVDDAATEAPGTETAKAPDPIVVEQTVEEVDEDLEKLRGEYPEIAEPMIKMMQKQNAENKALKDRLDKQDERNKQSDKDAKETKENAHYNAIAEVHPDFNEISQEPLLDDWINGLDPIERVGAEAIRNGGKTKDVIALLTKFKKANGYKVPGETPKDTPNTKIAKAKTHVTPQFNKAKEVNTQDRQIKFTQEQISKWTDKEWAENEAAVDEAMSQGLVR